MEENNQEFTVFNLKGKLIGIITEDSTVREVNLLFNNEDSRDFIFVDGNNEIIKYRYILGCEDIFPITVFKPIRTKL